MKKRKPSDFDLLTELQTRFPTINFLPGEEINKNYKGYIYLKDSENRLSEKIKLILGESSQHPDLDVIVEKFNADITEISNSGDFVIKPDFVKPSKKKVGFFVLKEKLQSIYKKPKLKINN